jgi:hypothetical protein
VHPVKYVPDTEAALLLQLPALVQTGEHCGYPRYPGRQLPHESVALIPSGQTSQRVPCHALRHKQVHPVVTVPIASIVFVALHSAVTLHRLE